LLQRAQSLSSEHSELTASIENTTANNENYSPLTAKRLGVLNPIVDSLTAYNEASSQLSELQSLLVSDPDLSSLAQDDILVAETALSTAAKELESALVPRHPFADLGCIIEIRPGAGGSEAALFVGDLARMYLSYLAQKNLRAVVLKCEDTIGTENTVGTSGLTIPTEKVGLAEVVIEVEEKGAYGTMKCEAGVHRVQRVPATESKGRIHTSSASVMVLPLFGENMSENEDGALDEKDVKMEFMRARGAGGQHVNKTNSAVRLTHIPTGTVVAIQDQRSQHKNRDKAWQVLRGKIAEIEREEKEAETLKLRRGVVAVGKSGRENKIRTYNWGQQRVTDHRSGCTVHNLDNVVEGGENLEQVMESVRQWQRDEDVLNLGQVD